MASGLNLIVLLCLTSGLWTEAKVQNETAGCSETCPSGWTQFERRCYIFYNSEKEWADAESFCTSLGGNLASIHTKEELRFLREIVYRSTNSHKTTWVGGSDSQKHGVWLWSDGSKFDFKLWGKGEPSSAEVEGCMEINFAGQKVNDAGCHMKIPFICARNP